MTILYAQGEQMQGSGIAAFLPFILIGLIFYFLILRPQNKHKNDHETMLANLKAGDKILTRGGIYGKIVNFQGKTDHIITLDIGSGTKIKIARSYVASLDSKKD
ncbi:MAG: preprotein translocase subunit YajC [Candidatus Neomarinimicrobiota bacterium]|nr:preprotein translocase subunit YajC [Candidatus Neomarinimicrobiota bacterium]